MGGFHPLDLLILLVIGLAIFGPKALQSVARNVGKGVGQAKVMKDKLMEELPVEEFSKVSESVPRIPLNSRQAVQMLVTSEKKDAAKQKSPEASGEASQESSRS